MEIQADELPTLNPRFADTVFCDDVRKEDTGKLVMVGVYGARMLLPGFPALLPSLALLVRMRTPLTRPFKFLATEVLHDGATLVTSISDESLLSQVSARAAEMAQDKDRSIIVASLIEVGPLPLIAPGKIQVRVRTESEILIAGALEIGQMDGASGE